MCVSLGVRPLQKLAVRGTREVPESCRMDHRVCDLTGILVCMCFFVCVCNGLYQQLECGS